MGNNNGFDIVIMNPPYVRHEGLGREFKTYVKRDYQTYVGTADLYVYFIEKSHSLLKPNGIFGMICSSKFTRSNYGKALRNYLVSNTAIKSIIDFGELPVFQGASTFPLILISSKIATEKQSFVYAAIKRLDFQSLTKEIAKIGNTLSSKSISGDVWTLASNKEIELFEKMKENSQPLGEYVDGAIFYGIKTGLDKAFIIDESTREELIREHESSAEIIKLSIRGRDVRRYKTLSCKQYLIAIPCGWTKEKTKGIKNKESWFRSNYPSIYNHLSQFSSEAKKRWDKGDYWWELRSCAYYNEFEKPKIIFPIIAKESRMTFDSTGLFVEATTYIIPKEDLYLLGILNSKLVYHYVSCHSTVIGDADKRGRLQWMYRTVTKIPIKPIDFSNPSEKLQHDRMVDLVNQMFEVQKELRAAEAVDEKPLQQKSVALDHQIDALTYKLYNLTEKEIEIVEGK